VRELVNLPDVRVRTYPELLSDRGYDVGLVNPLIFWPLPDFGDGICVSGLLTPPDADTWTHPPKLSRELTERGYRIDVRYGNRPYGFVDDEVFDEVELKRMKSDLFDLLEKRIEYARRLVEQSSLDYLYVLFKSVDIIQHCFWIHMVEDDDRFGDTIRRSYERIDEFLGWVRDIDDANIAVFSDHGFQTRRPPPSPVVVEAAKQLQRILPIPQPVKDAYRRLFNQPDDVDLGDPGRITGSHANPSAWLFSGPDVVPCDERTVRFEDLTLTLLATLDAPILRDYNWEVLTPVVDVDPTVTDPGFGSSAHPSMAPFAAGEAKEGVGMGGALALADRVGPGMADVCERVRAVYERLDLDGETGADV